ncbi:MAG TPA: hypothetical protein ENG30_00925, partial [Thermofilaceae archaeon]|nr:hypothetical protein [Thermofilaceae archaeon]
MERRRAVKFLFSWLSLSILNILRCGPSYPRRIAEVLGKNEAAVVRALKELERLGIVESKWARIRDRNVKIYKLKVREININVGKEGFRLLLRTRGNTYEPTYSSVIPEYRFFVDRRFELEAISSARGVVIIVGLPGMGKTALASEYARRHRGPTIWVDVTSSMSLRDLLRKLAVDLSSYGYGDLARYMLSGGGRVDVSVSLACGGLESLSALLVLDDLHRCRDPGVLEFIEHLDKRLTKAKVVATSTRTPRLALERGRVITVGPLPLKAIAQLLSLYGIKVKPSYLGMVYAATGGIPLIVSLLASLARSDHAYSLPIGGRRIVSTLISRMLDELDEPCVKLLRLISTFRKNPLLEEVEEVYGRCVGYMVNRLASLGLLRIEDGRVVVHEIIKEHVYRAMEDRRKMHAKLAQYYIERSSSHGDEGYFEAFYHLVKACKYERALMLRFRQMGKGISYKDLDAYRDLLREIPVDDLDNRSKAIYILCRADAGEVNEGELWRAVKLALLSGDRSLLAAFYSLLSSVAFREGRIRDASILAINAR